MRDTNSGTDANHDVHLVVKSRIVLRSAHEKHATAERISKIGCQFVLPGYVEHVVNAGRNVIMTQFVPPEQQTIFNLECMPLSTRLNFHSRKIPKCLVYVRIQVGVFSGIPITSGITQPDVVSIISQNKCWINNNGINVFKILYTVSN